MKAIWSFLITVVIFSSCSNDADKPAEIEEITTKEAPATAMPTVKEQLPEWNDYLASQVNNYEAAHFEATYSYAFENFEPTNIDGHKLNLYQTYFAYNADASKAIDIYSYNLLLSRVNNKIIARMGEPDSQINLIDLKNKTSQRIFFTGPSVSFWDARWIDSNKIIVAGTEEKRPAYWIIDLSQKNILTYEYADSTATLRNERDYLKKKFEGVVFL